MEAQSVREVLQARLAECCLELHPTKTRIVYCKDDRRRGKTETVMFDFLSYCFRPRSVLGPRSQRMFCGFTPAVSKPALNAMRATIRGLKLRKRSEVTLDDIARELNPMVRRWIEPPPNEWTPVVGSESPEVSNARTSTSVVHGRLQAPGR